MSKDNSRASWLLWPLSLEQWLLTGALFFALVTVVAQWLSNTPVWRNDSPVDISSDLIASLGLAFAGFQAHSTWAHRLLRDRWLLGCLGMLMIWSCETAVELFGYIDYRLIIFIWIMATIPIVICVRFYATVQRAFRVLSLGMVAQVIAHLAWITQECLVSGHQHSQLEALTDTAQLCALLAYIVAFVLLRLSRLDQSAMCQDRLRRWQRADARLRICFPYNAQIHQILHSLPIAAALAKRYPELEVHIAGSAKNLQFVQQQINQHRVETPLHFDTLAVPWKIRYRHRDGRVGSKKKILRANQLYFSGFDAVVTPERTSTYLRQLCGLHTQLIGTEHGAGDRAVSFAAQIAQYDFLLLPGEKQARRLLELGYIQPGQFVSGIYAKFDWTLGAKHFRLFKNDRPTVLYNPHFDNNLSSWPIVGLQVLEYFSQNTDYNLIFAPHIRLFDAPTAEKYQAFAKYRDFAHLHIDLGSERCVDMTYTRGADIYLGDVSSQVVEFIALQTRPCVFLNPCQVAWQADLHYRFWQLGPVITSISELGSALAEIATHERVFGPRQQAYVADTLGLVQPGSSGGVGADAIVAFLRRTAVEQGR